MTVEVLGTVIGTAIQGQIVGQAKAPCLQDQNGSVVVSEALPFLKQRLTAARWRCSTLGCCRDALVAA